MSDYGKILKSIWSDRDFIALDARSQQVYFLLLSHHTRNYAGVLPLSIKRWIRVSADATAENMTESLKRLINGGFILIDGETDEVLIRTYMRNDESYKQANVMKAALRCAREVESPKIRAALRVELEKISRLEGCKNINLVTETLKQLVSTPIGGLAEPLAEGLDEDQMQDLAEGQSEVSAQAQTLDLGEPPVVVPYVKETTATTTSNPNGNHNGTAIAVPSDQTQSKEVALQEESTRAAVLESADRRIIQQRTADAAELILQVIPEKIDRRSKIVLRDRSAELLADDVEPEIIKAALRLWLEKPQLGPGALHTLVSEVIRSQNAKPRVGSTDQQNIEWENYR